MKLLIDLEVSDEAAHDLAAFIHAKGDMTDALFDLSLDLLAACQTEIILCRLEDDFGVGR